MLSIHINHYVDIGYWTPISMGSNKYQLSHLFYADDLTLICRIDKKSPTTMLQCLNYFYKLFGQLINLNKSKLIVSRNCPKHTSKELVKLFNINTSKSFGKYLGYPITNNKPKPSDYQFIIDNMTRKLASWKSNFLSMAGRVTLASSTLNSMPNHNMHYNFLPMKILNLIDKLQRNFIWGSTLTTKKNSSSSLGHSN